MRWMVAGVLGVGVLVVGFAIRYPQREPAVPLILVPEPPPIEWQLPLANFRSSSRTVSGGLDESLPRAERVRRGLEELRHTRALARHLHEVDRVHFDPSQMDARLVRDAGRVAEIRVLDPDELDDSWDFLVHDHGIQKQYRVTRIEGERVWGRFRASCDLPPASGRTRRVLLLRPTSERPLPRRRGGSPLIFEQRLRRDLVDISLATNSGTLRYANQPAPDPFGTTPDSGSGRLLAVATERDGTTMVTLSIGRMDGVRLGDEICVARGSKFVGFARITQLRKKRAVGKFDTLNAGAGAPPEPDDLCYRR